MATWAQQMPFQNSWYANYGIGNLHHCNDIISRLHIPPHTSYYHHYSWNTCTSTYINIIEIVSWWLPVAR